MKILDIAIGLILIYFLYSLLCSIIVEILSSWLGMRARMLKQGIENILNDRKVGSKQDVFKYFVDIFLVEDKSFKYTNAGKFYEEPSIKYLAKPGEHVWYSLRNRKPSYISSENFVMTVLNMLSAKGRGVSEWDKIKFAIETNALHLEPETLQMFRNMVSRSNDQFINFVDILQHHFVDTMDRVNGWYKRKIGTILFFVGFIICTLFHVDTIKIVKSLANDTEKRLHILSLAERVVDENPKTDVLLTQQDSLNALQSKRQAFEMTKNWAQEADQILGLAWAFPIVQSTYKIYIDTVGNDPLRITKSDIKQIDSLIKLLDTMHICEYFLNSITANKIAYADTLRIPSTLLVAVQKTLNIKWDKSQAKKVFWDSLSAKSSYADTKVRIHILDLQKTIEQERKAVIAKLNEMTSLKLHSYSSIEDTSKFALVTGKSDGGLWRKAGFIICQMVPWKPTFWGIVITALALTLGAPFWFDLLKKLVSLRSVGVKPSESEEKKQQLHKLKLEGEKVTSKDAAEAAISHYRGIWEKISGLVAINKTSLNTVEIVAEDVDAIRNILGEKVMAKDDFEEVKLVYKQGEKAILLDKARGYIFLDDEEKRGTICGILQHNKTSRPCYLTCAHVVQRYEHGHFEYQNSEVKDINGPKAIGQVINLIRSSFMDVAIIEGKDKSLNGKYGIEEIKSIISLDELSATQAENIYFKSNLFDLPILGKLDMPLYNCKFENNRFMYGLFLIHHEDEERYSDGGDSGALIYVHENGEDVRSKKIAVGMLIGAATYDGSRYSLGIRLQDICSVLAVKPIP